MSLDSPVLVVFSIATNLAWYSLGVVNWHGNLKQVLVGAQHKLVIYGDSSLVFCFSSLRVEEKVYFRLVEFLIPWWNLRPGMVTLQAWDYAAEDPGSATAVGTCLPPPHSSPSPPSLETPWAPLSFLPLPCHPDWGRPRTLGLCESWPCCISKHCKHQGGRGNAGDMHHHRTNFYKYHPDYFGKVGMRHYHLKRNQSFCPTVNLDKLWTLVSEQTRVNAAKTKPGAAPIIDVVRSATTKFWARESSLSNLSSWRPNSSAEELKRRLRVLEVPVFWWLKSHTGG